MNNLIKFIELKKLKDLTDIDEFKFLIHPKYVTGFQKKTVDISEKEYIDNHYSNIEDYSDYNSTITYYLVGYLEEDSFKNNHQLSCIDFISAAIYLIADLYSIHSAYPFAWNGIYLIKENNVKKVFFEIYKSFYKTSSNHVKNLLRIFCIELLDEFSCFLDNEDTLKYDKIKDFKTEFTYMY